ncbi:MAG TPA: hypothetical protein VJX67_19345, partial [Blastocatellia bacterium]|nr:hypothetical protein [Blastocatellia bacterium]
MSGGQAESILLLCVGVKRRESHVRRWYNYCMVRWSVVLCVMSAAVALASPVTYSVAPIVLPSTPGQPPACDCDVYGPNNSGQVVGFVNESGTFGPSFIATTSGFTLLPTPPGAFTTDLNNLGQVTGDVRLVGSEQAFIANTSGIVLLKLPSGSLATYTRAINDPGQVAVQDNNGLFFIETTSGIANIPSPPGATLESIEGMNNSGEVVGTLLQCIESSPPCQESGTIRAFMGSASGTVPISSPPGWIYAIAMGINNSGEVAGYGGPSSGPDQSFVWSSASGMTFIPMLNGASYCNLNEGRPINDSGTVVGYCDTGTWVWDSTMGTQPLNNLVPSGWVVDGVFGINDPGQILAT